MYRLDNGFEGIRPLIAGMEHHLSVHALAAGEMPGWVYVDDPGCPRSAFAFNAEGWYLIGDARNQPFNAWLRSFLRDQVVPEARSQSEEELPLHFYPADWEQSQTDILPDLSYRMDYQKYFRFTGPLLDGWQELPAGSALRLVDAQLLSEQDRIPVPDLIAWARGGFGSVEAFLAAGIGMCLEREGQVVSWCMPDCTVGTWCELGVHTLASERRQGYAAITVAATVNGCRAKGFRHIGWHCWSANEASARLAQKVGFGKVMDHPAFLVDARLLVERIEPASKNAILDTQ